jgi:hypothetical protein
MKNSTILFITLIGFNLSLNSQVIDHTCIDLDKIPKNYIDSAKAKLFIGYGHTSHGSQIPSGMDAIEEYFTDGTYDWSHSGGENELHLHEGGILEKDLGYDGWDDKTRTYLDATPQCNVIIWSWCGQVNDVNLQTHLFDNMEDLEAEYPDVTFVYMTGHLEGQGPEGKLYTANQQIRDYCKLHNKYLFDFADIEKYDPDALVNYQEYYVDDKCYYKQDGETKNWANDWLKNNPSHELSLISRKCGGCAHSVSLNCVKKGVAIWYLWAQLAGWVPENDPITSSANPAIMNSTLTFNAHFNQAQDILEVSFKADHTAPMHLSVFSITGQEIYTGKLNTSIIGKNKFHIPLQISRGIYIVRLNNKYASNCIKIIN